MPTIILYECKRLRARLSLASCEANRAKPDNAVMLSEELSYAIRPYPCRACTDWQAWNNTNTEEVTVPKSESRTPICTECGKEKPIIARGMCRSCYDRNYVRRNASQKTASAPEVVPAPDTVPVPQFAEPQPASAPAVYVLMVPGWEASVGVTAEVEAAKARAIPVTHILPLPLQA